ncbi:MAG: lytic transglycosylase domain-containing protein [Solirubrobacterales bacterium]
MSARSGSRRSTAKRRSATRGKSRAGARRPAKRSRGKARRSSSKGGVRRAGLAALAVLLGLSAGFLLFRGDVENVVRQATLPLNHEDIIRQQAGDKDVDADLLAAVIYSESRFRDQTSSAGARGLMQITPETAKAIEQLSGGNSFQLEDLSDPDLNIRYGTFYLRHLLDKFGDNEVAAIAAYNAGESNVTRWGGADLTLADITFPETRAYVESVLDKRNDYRRTYGSELGF